MSQLEKDNRYIFWRHDERPTFFMMVGLAGSGKSDLASIIYCENENGIIQKPIIHSSDALRLEIFGDYDDEDQSKKEIVLKEIKNRIKKDLNEVKNVIYDATNLNTKLRTSVLTELKKTGAYKQCILSMTPFDECIRRNNERETHNVPESQIKRTYMTFTPPGYQEGWDNILPIYNYELKDFAHKYNIDRLLKEMDSFEQGNLHHALSLGGHCRKTMQYINDLTPNDRALQMAAILHDCGKINTKTSMNAKGENDGQSHYYQHHAVGAYEAMFYLKHAGVSNEEQLDIANLIYYHMHPSSTWEQSKRATNKAMNFLGNKMFERIMTLHTADVRAHSPIQARKLDTKEKNHSEGELNIER